ncbi:hypothetical protein K8S19_02265 [bacterium]|nr:hypothetical protein [bacterium]
MNRLWIVSIIVLMAVLPACMQGKIPQRSIDYQKPQEVVKSYYDYRRLEKAGVETIKIKTRYFDRTVSLAYYLYTIARAFESFGRETDAKRLYLRLLMNYPLLYQGGQLGIMTENRLIWLLGDKSWVVTSVDELILRLERAVIKQDAPALRKLISRDFGFGRDYNERFAVKYKDGLEVIVSEFGNLEHPQVEIVSKIEDDTIVLKTTGWESGNKNWFFSLHKNHRLQGWEWDLAYWEMTVQAQ